jgi:hypothetical protein
MAQVSSGFGRVGRGAPRGANPVPAQDITSGASGLAAKAAKAGAVKSVKLKIKMKGAK